MLNFAEQTGSGAMVVPAKKKDSAIHIIRTKRQALPKCIFEPLSKAIGQTSLAATTTKSIAVIPNQCNASSRGSQFDNIYEKGGWGTKLKDPSSFYGNAQWPPSNVRKSSGSGGGSDLGHATENSLRIIREKISALNLRSMVDVPCGDVNWIMDSYETDTLPAYLGLDITKAVIEANQKRFDHHKNKAFRLWDATECVLPRFFNKTTMKEQPFDLVHVRDVIQHLSLDQGISFFCNVFRSGVNFMLTTTYRMSSRNRNIEEGGWYQNSLEKEPFNFPTDDQECTPTHPELENDSTCFYNLTLPWVQTFIAEKCQNTP